MFFERAPDAPPPAVSTEQTAAIRTADPRVRRAGGLCRGIGARHVAGLLGLRRRLSRRSHGRAGARDHCGPARGDHLAAHPRRQYAARLLVLSAALSAMGRTRRRASSPRFSPRRSSRRRRLPMMAYDVPPPPPEEIVYIRRPVLVFDDPVFGVRAAAPAAGFFPAPPPPEFVVLRTAAAAGRACSCCRCRSIGRCRSGCARRPTWRRRRRTT